MKTKGQQFIEKTAQHTFINSAGYFVKVLIVQYEGKDYAICMKFKEKNAYINVYTTADFNCVSSLKKNYVCNSMKNMVFPSYVKHTSIPTFKAMKELMTDITNTVKGKDPKDQATKRYIFDLIITQNMSVKK